MNTRPIIAFLFLCALTTGFSEPSDKEIIAVMNKVERGVAAGKIGALNDLLTLPPEWAVPGFLTIFKENYNVYGATPTNRAIGDLHALCDRLPRHCEPTSLASGPDSPQPGQTVTFQRFAETPADAVSGQAPARLLKSSRLAGLAHW